MCKPSEQNNSRLSLLESGSCASMELHGILVAPLTAREEIFNKTVHVKISHPKSWVIEVSSPEVEGIWVKSAKAWYKLLEPCTSQQDHHIQIKAKCNLAFDITAIFLHGQYRKRNELFHPILLHKTLREENNVDPFNLELLKRAPSFVKKHIKYLIKGNLITPDFTSRPFYCGLSKIESTDFDENTETIPRSNFHRSLVEEHEKRWKWSPYGKNIFPYLYTTTNQPLKEVPSDDSSSDDSSSDGCSNEAHQGNTSHIVVPKHKKSTEPTAQMLPTNKRYTAKQSKIKTKVDKKRRIPMQDQIPNFPCQKRHAAIGLKHLSSTTKEDVLQETLEIPSVVISPTNKSSNAEQTNLDTMQGKKKKMENQDQLPSFPSKTVQHHEAIVSNFLSGNSLKKFCSQDILGIKELNSRGKTDPVRDKSTKEEIHLTKSKVNQMFDEEKISIMKTLIKDNILLRNENYILRNENVTLHKEKIAQKRLGEIQVAKPKSKETNWDMQQHTHELNNNSSKKTQTKETSTSSCITSLISSPEKKLHSIISQTNKAGKHIVNPFRMFSPTFTDCNSTSQHSSIIPLTSPINMASGNPSNISFGQTAGARARLSTNLFGNRWQPPQSPQPYKSQNNGLEIVHSSDQPKISCYFFSQGKCRYGNNCKFSHS